LDLTAVLLHPNKEMGGMRFGRKGSLPIAKRGPNDNAEKGGEKEDGL